MIALAIVTVVPVVVVACLGCYYWGWSNGFADHEEIMTGTRRRK